MRNAVTRDLHSPKYHQRIIKLRKGKGSYNRKDKNND